MPGINRILVPTDFSPASDIALQYAIDLTERFDARIHLLHVIDDTSFAAAYPDGVYVEIPGLRERLISEATDQLSKPVARCAAAGLEARAEVIVGHPARTIVKTATAQGIDMIVMGTHGRGGFAHLLLGSVAERVVRTGPCAVLTVRDGSPLADVLAAESVDAKYAALR